MNIYTLWHTDECGTDHEHEFEAENDANAINHASIVCAGTEGLWTGVSVTNSDGDEIFRPYE